MGTILLKKILIWIAIVFFKWIYLVCLTSNELKNQNFSQTWPFISFFLFFSLPKSKLLMKKKINWDSKTKHPKKLNMVGLLDQKKISFHSFLFQLFNMINFNLCSDKLNIIKKKWCMWREINTKTWRKEEKWNKKNRILPMIINSLLFINSRMSTNEFLFIGL